MSDGRFKMEKKYNIPRDIWRGLSHSLALTNWISQEIYCPACSGRVKIIETYPAINSWKGVIQCNDCKKKFQYDTIEGNSILELVETI